MPEHQSMEHLEVIEVPEGFDVLEAQKHLQRQVYSHHGGYVPDREAMTFGELHDRLRDNHEALENEHAEMLDHLPWKAWKVAYHTERAHIVPRDLKRELKFESIDKLHFLLNEMIALGFGSWDEVVQMYYAKNRENLRRQESGY